VWVRLMYLLFKLSGSKMDVLLVWERWSQSLLILQMVSVVNSYELISLQVVPT
jgi:hypothetical protein